MPPSQMSELTQALETFNNVSLPALAFFFVVMFLFVMGYLIRALFGRDQRRDDLLKTALESSTENGKTLTGLKQDIADTLRRLSDDNAAARKQHDETIASFTAVVTTHNGSLTALATEVNKTTLNLAALKASVDELKSETKLYYDRLAILFPRDEPMGDMLERMILDAVKEACAEKKATDEQPAINVTPIEPTPETDIPQEPGTGLPLTA